ncbi:MAG: hypothetical protein WAV02_07410 [Stellaceae bacterium]
MRVLAAAIMLVLVASAERGLAASSAPPAISPEDAHAGCVHTDLRRCMISLGSAFWFEMNLVTPQIAHRNELDVNGNTAHRRITIDAKILHHRETIGIKLTLASPAPNDEVVKVTLHLPRDPDLAHTGSEYDETELYDVVAVVLGNRCPALDRMALYRFYENSLKPLEKPKIETRTDGSYYWARSTVDTAPALFCGAMFSVHRASDWQGPYIGPTRPNEIIVKRAKGLTTIDIE